MKVKPQIKKAKTAELIEQKLEILEQKEKTERDDDEKSNKDKDSDAEMEDVRASFKYIWSLQRNN